jgi:hypothetical protein
MALTAKLDVAKLARGTLLDLSDGNSFPNFDGNPSQRPDLRQLARFLESLGLRIIRESSEDETNLHYLLHAYSRFS